MRQNCLLLNIGEEINIFHQNCLQQIIEGVRVRNGILKGYVGFFFLFSKLLNFVRNFVEIPVAISFTGFTELNN